MTARVTRPPNRNASGVVGAKPRRLPRLVLYAFIVVLGALVLLPIVYALFGSLKPLDQLLAGGADLLPRTWSFSNYTEAWQRANFSRYFLNSIIITASVVAFDTVASSMLGYVLARKKLRGQRVLEGVLGATLFLGIGTITLYPKLAIAQSLHMANLSGIIFVEIAAIMVVHVFLIKAYCQSLGTEVEEAARIDGCGFFGTYVRVALPLMFPILGTTSILSFQAAWNGFQVPLVFTLSSPELRTVVVGVYSLQAAGLAGSSPWNLMLAGSVMALVPVIVAFIFLQKYFYRGFAEGATKG